MPMSPDALDPGYDVPARPGMTEAEIQTPALILDAAALERNIAKMQALADDMGVRLRVHGKMHKSVDVARLQIAAGACGVCCQKVSEAEAFARGGISDILVSNQVRDPAKIDRLARMPKLGCRVTVCIDDIDNVAELSEAAQRHGTELSVLVEIDCGTGRCGVPPGPHVIAMARAVAAAEGLRFAGLQAYEGAAQHIRDHAARKATIERAVSMVRSVVDDLAEAGFSCEIVGGAGTGTFRFEGTSGVYNELQCGSYAFMDADYQRVLDEDGTPISDFENALFVLAGVMSKVRPGHAVTDAGIKVQAVDTGLADVYGHPEMSVIRASDEHGELSDPGDVLKVNDRVRLVPGHCDPTCNLHDWYVVIRDDVVEALWPVSARGKSW